MQNINWTKLLYYAAALLAVVGALLKITGNQGWEIVWIAAAAAMLVHVVLDQVKVKQKKDT